MFLKLLSISIIFVAVAFTGMAISILLKSRGKFPETHIGRNKEMGKRGITCAQNVDTGCNPDESFSGCSTCGARRL